MNNQSPVSSNLGGRSRTSEFAEPHFVPTEYCHVRQKLLEKRDAMDLDKELNRYTPGNFNRRDFYYPSLHPQRIGSLAMDEAFEAAGRGDTDFVRTLLFAALPVNSKNSKGDTLLHVAVRQRNTLLCLELLSFRAEARIPNKNNQTPLDIANECSMEVPYLKHLLQTGLKQTGPLFDGLW
eukprot:GEMP01084146.1.p1 GENE.GEMP01084146.1~~GEMP01084146.1.p1  ORF type:complete len:180 (+),score=34.73 GEMP01084146.1:173-712(+)